MKIALLQLDTAIGKPTENAARIAEAVRSAQEEGADFCIAPDLALCGFDGEDLARLPGLAQSCREAWEELAKGLKDAPAVLFGTLVPGSPQPAAVLLYKGNSSVLPLSSETAFSFMGSRFALSRDIPEAQPAQRPDINLCLSTMRYSPGWQHRHATNLLSLSRAQGSAVLSVHSVGCNQGAIAPGESMVIDDQGRMVARGKAFREDIIYFDTHAAQPALPMPEATADEGTRCAELWNALVLGLRDRVCKNGFSSVVVGLSGGIDSAVTACIAAEALGAKNVLGITMPSPHSSGHSITDSEELAASLGINIHTVAISQAMETLNGLLAPVYNNAPQNIAEENIQARIRGLLLMSIANKFGKLVLETGNKSEAATGYCTLYGDTVGALSVIGDVYKTEVYKLANWYNRTHPDRAIPHSTLTKAPSAELAPNQKDSDSLPPYPVLDAILMAILEQGKDKNSLRADGFKQPDIDRTMQLLVTSQFKRAQLPPQLIVSTTPFGAEWRLPF